MLAELLSQSFLAGKPGDVHHVYLNLFLNIAGLGFGDGRKVTLWAEQDLFAVNFSSVPPWSLLGLTSAGLDLCNVRHFSPRLNLLTPFLVRVQDRSMPRV